MFGERTVLRPTKAGRATEAVDASPLILEPVKMLAWSPDDTLASSATMLWLAISLMMRFWNVKVGSITAVRLNALGRFTELLPRSRFRLVVSSIKDAAGMNSNVFTSGASEIVC